MDLCRPDLGRRVRLPDRGLEFQKLGGEMNSPSNRGRTDLHGLPEDHKGKQGEGAHMLRHVRQTEPCKKAAAKYMDEKAAHYKAVLAGLASG